MHVRHEKPLNISAGKPQWKT